MKGIGKLLPFAGNERSFGAHQESADALQVINTSKNSVIVSKLEVADTPSRRSKGLLGRKGLEPGEGLWIIPCESIHTFWMHFSIDLIYLDRALRVKKVCYCVRPWRISACLTAHSILELPCGAISESKTQPGDQVEVSALENPSKI